ncbi:hypothetical protein L1887_58417 [Cichorium endivia]|nr:hypothetical protein L1887_58417 [Cichorium endivia]
MPVLTVSTRTMTCQRAFSSACVRGSEDKRAASAKIFSLDEVEAGIKALEDAGYERASVWEQRVVWGDHDQFQHVNNVHFVRWFENARMFFANSFLETDNFTPERKLEITRGTGKSFILAGINVRYRRPVVYPDTVSHPSPPSLLLDWWEKGLMLFVGFVDLGGTGM